MLGRWSLTAPLFENAPTAGPRLRALAELMLERHGIVTRETAIAEGIPGGFAAIYGELQNLELLGTARRGYFVEGLGGAQFALPGAVERLRSMPRAGGRADLAGRHRPRQPLRRHPPVAEAARAAAARPGPPAPTSACATASRCSTSSAAGKGILRLAPLEGEELAAALGELAAAARDGLIEKLALERLDGETVIGSDMEAALVEAGFRRQPRRLVA